MADDRMFTGEDGKLLAEKIIKNTDAIKTKVDKVNGKDLSTNDYTDADKQKLAGLVDIKAIGAGLTLDPETGTLSGTNGSGGGAGIAELFDYNTTDPIDLDGAHDIGRFMEQYLNLEGFADPVGTSKLGYKVPVVEVGSYAWSEPAQEDIQTAAATVTVTFADGSTIVKDLNFRTTKNRRVYAAKPVSGSGAYIDLGLVMNYGYTLRATGYTPAGSQSVLIGAFVSTSMRTTGRLLGGSNKLQHMWPGSTDYALATTGIDITKEFTYQQSADKLWMWNASTNYEVPVTGKTTSGTAEAPLLLFNEAPSADFNRGVIVNARVYDVDGTEIRNMHPVMLDGEIVFVDVADGIESEIIDDILENGSTSVYASYIYHTQRGRLVEVTEEEVNAA